MPTDRDELAEAMASVAASIDILTQEFKHLARLLDRAGLAAHNLSQAAKAAAENRYTETGSLRIVREDEPREQ